MEMIKVNSSAINSISYANGDLTIEFNSGRSYVYHDVPADVYLDFLNADSHGRYFNQNIAKNFTGERV